MPTASQNSIVKVPQTLSVSPRKWFTNGLIQNVVQVKIKSSQGRLTRYLICFQVTNEQLMFQRQGKVGREKLSITYIQKCTYRAFPSSPESPFQESPSAKVFLRQLVPISI